VGSNNVASEQEDQEAEADSEENLKGITGRREQHGMTMMHMVWQNGMEGEKINANRSSQT
jgi:hypothetical protein